MLRKVIAYWGDYMHYILYNQIINSKLVCPPAASLWKKIRFPHSLIPVLLITPCPAFFLVNTVGQSHFSDSLIGFSYLKTGPIKVCAPQVSPKKRYLAQFCWDPKVSITYESKIGFTLSSKIQDLLLLNLKFKQESRICSNNISISIKIWEFKKSKSQLQARSVNLK